MHPRVTTVHPQVLAHPHPRQLHLTVVPIVRLLRVIVHPILLHHRPVPVRLEEVHIAEAVEVLMEEEALMAEAEEDPSVEVEEAVEEEAEDKYAIILLDTSRKRDVFILRGFDASIKK